MGTTTFPGRDWEVAEPGTGVDIAALRAAVDGLVGRPVDQGRTSALCVVHRGRIVAEWCAPDTDPTTTHISWSMAKSVTHALVGMAVGDGLLDPDSADLLPQWRGDGRAGIALRHLLTMTSGLSWVEDYVDDTASDVITMLFGDSDHVGDHAAFAAAKPLVDVPGSTWVYSSGTTNIIARILADALGEPKGSHAVVESFMRSRLFGPIGMSTATPKFDAAGTFVGSSYVYSSARDFARFGWLYLNDGCWNGERLLPPGWVDDARTQIAFDPEMGHGYGSHWWTCPQDPGAFMAHGYEGQITWVSPSRGVVAVHMGRTPAEHAGALRDRVWRVVSAFRADAPVIGHDGGHG